MGTVLVLWWLFYVICWILSIFCRVKRYLLSLMVGLAMLMACSKPVKVEVPERFEIGVAILFWLLRNGLKTK